MGSWRPARRPHGMLVALLLAGDVLVLLLAGAALLSTTWSSPRLTADSAETPERSAASPMAGPFHASTAPRGAPSTTAPVTTAAAAAPLAVAGASPALTAGLSSGATPSAAAPARAFELAPLLVIGAALGALATLLFAGARTLGKARQVSP